MNCLELSLSESTCFHQLNCIHATIYGPGVVMTTASYLDWTVLQSGGSLWFVSWSHVTHSHAILLGCVIQIIEWIDLLHVHVTWSIAGRDENGLQSLLIQWCGYITVLFCIFRRKWFIDCSCILQCFYVSVNRHDGMKWFGCRKQPVCGVLHSHHVILWTGSLKVLATINSLNANFAKCRFICIRD